MTVYFFIKYFFNGFDKYFKKISKCNAIFTFDLEDSIKMVNRKLITSELKNDFRDTLFHILDTYEFISQYLLAVRINHPEDPEFRNDLNLLSRITWVEWETIIIPKVENVSTIQYAIKCLNKKGIRFKNIGILIETQAGLLEIKKIVSQKPPQLKVFFFGHADYNLDSGRFPFVHQNDEIYWEWVSQLLRSIRNEDVIFINSPCLFLTNDELFVYGLQRLNRLNFSQVGQLTLTLNQSLLCNSNHSEKIVFKPDLPQNEWSAHFMAKELVNSYENINEGKSFSINETNYLISPHEYIAACNVLKESDSK